MWPLLLIVMLLVLREACGAVGVTAFQVVPSVTDSQIKSFDTPHHLYVNRSIIVEHKADLPGDRHQLLLWLTGTGGNGGDASAFCSLAANQGYHVVSLMYPDAIAAAVCRNDSDPEAFEQFRMAIIQGGKSKYNRIERSECVENRLIKLLQWVSERRPREDWGQFLTADGTIKWDAIAVAGQSQGGGHAALIGMKHLVARVICTGAPKDFSQRLRAPAAWYTNPCATPKQRFFAFNHYQDPKGCSPEQLLENLKALGLLQLGAPVDAAKDQPPYRHTRILMSSYPAVAMSRLDPESANAAHSSVIANRNADRWRSAWSYMLTENVP